MRKKIHFFDKKLLYYKNLTYEKSFRNLRLSNLYSLAAR